jgi:hypothetical protein
MLKFTDPNPVLTPDHWGVIQGIIRDSQLGPSPKDILRDLCGNSNRGINLEGYRRDKKHGAKLGLPNNEKLNVYFRANNLPFRLRRTKTKVLRLFVVKPVEK